MECVSQLLPQQMGAVLATLNDLVETLTAATALPEATVFAYGRFAREAGFIVQKGRGRSAAEMTVSDAANLLIAIGAASITREAGPIIQQRRALRGYLVPFRGEYSQLVEDWLQPLGLTKRDHIFELEANLGAALEFLILEAGSGRLHHFLAQLPTYDPSPALWRKWTREDSHLREMSVDELWRRGSIKPGFNKEVSLRQTFYRNLNLVELELVREWKGVDLVASLHFTNADRNLIMQCSTPFRLSAQLDQQCLTGLGLALQGIKFPADDWPIDFFDYFGIEAIPAVERALKFKRLRKGVA
jgi:hypothetical protein